MAYAYCNGIRYEVNDAIVNLKGWSRESEAKYLNLMGQPRSHRINDPNHFCYSCCLFNLLAERRDAAIKAGVVYTLQNTNPRVTKSVVFTAAIPSIWFIWRDHPETPYWRDGSGFVESRPTAFATEDHAREAIRSLMEEENAALERKPNERK